jgi:hypothetical protein
VPEPAPAPVVEPAPAPVVEPIAPPPLIMIPKPSSERNNLPEDVLRSIEKTISTPQETQETQETQESVIVKLFRNIGDFFQLRFGSRRLVTEQGARQTGH